ncbi:MAG: LPS assembly protein LptD, partial [Gammaproteobacteria bacterium]|nr:LPS assembly protein LptD [Gammaproteobacteria bacterium]
LRFDLLPSVSYPVYNASAFLEPRVGLRFTQYDLPESGTFDSNPNRILPIVSIDSGIFLERDATLFNTNFLQTLEPRLFYLYIPEENQNDLPVFDTAQFDFSFDSLFREDRFIGPDRMGDANQITFALTSRLINQSSGREAGHISLGQIYYMNERDVFLPGGKTREEDSSPIVAEIVTEIIDDWRLRGDLQWDPNNDKTEKLVGLIQYNPTPDKFVNLGYRVRKTTDSSTSSITTTDIEQSDISFHWPFNQNWSAVGRWTYATADEQTIDLFGGVEYNSCCWGFRVVGRRFLAEADGDLDTGIFLQLELKGLAGIGQKTVEFLEENLPGYKSGF